MIQLYINLYIEFFLKIHGQVNFYFACAVILIKYKHKIAAHVKSKN